jgi:hypothetical protein
MMIDPAAMAITITELNNDESGASVDAVVVVTLVSLVVPVVPVVGVVVVSVVLVPELTVTKTLSVTELPARS